MCATSTYYSQVTVCPNKIKLFAFRLAFRVTVTVKFLEAIKQQICEVSFAY